MKIPISEYACFNLFAPTLPAYESIDNIGATRWIVWCKHCNKWHKHGPMEGHREAHCHDPASPYQRDGYNLALAGKFDEAEITMADHLTVRVTLDDGTAVEFDVLADGAFEVLSSLSEDGCRDEKTGITYPAESIREIEVRNKKDETGPLPDPFSVN